MSHDPMKKRILRIVSTAVFASLLVTGLYGLWSVSANRAFQVDEAEHLHAAYNLKTGVMPYVDFHQIHPPLLHFLIAPGTDPEDPSGSYWRARRLMLGVLLLSILFCAGTAARLSNPLGGAIAAGLALSYTTLVERGIEARPDNLVNFFMLAALLLEAGTKKPDVRRFCVQGLLLGCAVLATPKAAFPCLAFGFLWLYSAVKHWRPLWVVLPMIAWALPIAVVAALAMKWGVLGQAFQEIFGDALKAAAGAESRATFSPMRFIPKEGGRNVFFLILGLVALGRSLLDLLLPSGIYRGLFGSLDGTTRRSLAFPGLLGAIMIASVWLNPFPWPYVHVGPAFVLAALSGTMIARFCGRYFGQPVLDWRSLTVAALVLLAAASTSALRLMEKATPRSDTNSTRYQLFMLEELSRITEPDDSAFDMIGLYFRPDAYPAYNLSYDLMRFYRKEGGYPPFIPSFRENELVAWIASYRGEWLPEEERIFLLDRMAQYYGNIFVLGRDLSRCPVDEPCTFDVLKTKPFRYDGPGSVEVNGEPFEKGVLEKGEHVVRITSGPNAGRIIMDTPEPYPPSPYDQIPGPGFMFITLVGTHEHYLFD